MIPDDSIALNSASESKLAEGMAFMKRAKDGDCPVRFFTRNESRESATPNFMLNNDDGGAEDGASSAGAGAPSGTSARLRGGMVFWSSSLSALYHVVGTTSGGSG